MGPTPLEVNGTVCVSTDCALTGKVWDVQVFAPLVAQYVLRSSLDARARFFVATILSHI